LCIYHPITVLLPTRGEGFWFVHDELESLQKQLAIIDLGKFVAHDLAIEGVGAVALKATEGVAAITLYLGLGSIIDAAIRGGGDPPSPIDVTAINININSLNTTTNSILGYINNYTRYSFLRSNGLDVSGYTSLKNNTTLLSSLNVSGYTSLNNNTTLLSSLNISGFSLFSK
jgi:hypothetical protein